MTQALVKSTENLTLIGSGPVSAAGLSIAIARAPHLVAADGGADRAHALGHRPSAIIGDMDSLSKVENWQNSDLAMYRIEEQDTTDFEKCLTRVEAPLILAVGFIGGRVDHTLAALNVLVRHGPRPVALLGEADVTFACGREAAIDVALGTPVSIFPMAPVRGTGSEGLEWPLDGLAFAPDAAVGTSNRATGPRVRVLFDRPGALMTVPLTALDQVIAALSTRAY